MPHNFRLGSIVDGITGAGWSYTAPWKVWERQCLANNLDRTCSQGWMGHKSELIPSILNFAGGSHRCSIVTDRLKSRTPFAILTDIQGPKLAGCIGQISVWAKTPLHQGYRKVWPASIILLPRSSWSILRHYELQPHAITSSCGVYWVYSTVGYGIEWSRNIIQHTCTIPGLFPWFYQNLFPARFFVDCVFTAWRMALAAKVIYAGIAARVVRFWPGTMICVPTHLLPIPQIPSSTKIVYLSICKAILSNLDG